MYSFGWFVHFHSLPIQIGLILLILFGVFGSLLSPALWTDRSYCPVLERPTSAICCCVGVIERL